LSVVITEENNSQTEEGEETKGLMSWGDSLQVISSA
jgi:hypothetical protein